MNQQEAAKNLGLTDRQIRRLVQKYRLKGASGVISRKRGAPGNYRLKVTLNYLVSVLIRSQYALLIPHLPFDKTRTCISKIVGACRNKSEQIAYKI